MPTPLYYQGKRRSVLPWDQKLTPQQRLKWIEVVRAEKLRIDTILEELERPLLQPWWKRAMIWIVSPARISERMRLSTQSMQAEDGQ
jgi:hypothetical protein